MTARRGLGSILDMGPSKKVLHIGCPKVLMVKAGSLTESIKWINWQKDTFHL